MKGLAGLAVVAVAAYTAGHRQGQVEGEVRGYSRGLTDMVRATLSDLAARR